MCTLKDYEGMMILGPWATCLREELESWHQIYLPASPEKLECVLDVGAGCGETVKFWLMHGAKRVIAIEPADGAFFALARNFAGDPRVILVPAAITHIKIDAEGAEDGMIVETHSRDDKWEIIGTHDTRGEEKPNYKHWRLVEGEMFT